MNEYAYFEEYWVAKNLEDGDLFVVKVYRVPKHPSDDCVCYCGTELDDTMEEFNERHKLIKKLNLDELIK